MKDYLHKITRKSLTTVYKLFDFDYLTSRKVELTVKLEKIGSEYGGWYVPLDFLNKDSTIYCAGCGEDITFDLGLINLLDCDIHGFDPTPRAISYVTELVSNEPKYIFHPIGIWDQLGTLNFYVPADTSHVSHSLVNLQKTSSHIEVKVNSIENLMRELNHSSIDLLKLDIEGAEYRVLDSLIASQITPKILCVEFDEFYNPLDYKYRGRIQACVAKLIENGYQLIHSEFNGNYTFIQKPAVKHVNNNQLKHN